MLLARGYTKHAGESDIYLGSSREDGTLPI